jgi:hypothetical protein
MQKSRRRSGYAGMSDKNGLRQRKKQILRCAKDDKGLGMTRVWGMRWV